jgi:hypothetical protein
MTETMKLSDSRYRLFRKMDGELILQHFHLTHMSDDYCTFIGHWKNVETVNEGKEKK